MKLPKNVLEKIEYYEVKNFVNEPWSTGPGYHDEVILHFKPSRVLWGLWHKSKKKKIKLTCMKGGNQIAHSQEYFELVNQLNTYLDIE